MAIALSVLFTRLGKIAGAFRTINGMVGTGAPNPAAVWGSTPGGLSGAGIRCLDTILQGVQGQLQTPYPDLLAGGSYGVSTPFYSLQTSVPSALGTALTQLQKLGQGVIMHAVNDDLPIPNITIALAIAELGRQMVSQAATIHANQVSSTVTAGGGNTGNPTFVISTLDANGKTLEYAYNETMIATTTFDLSDGAVAGNETIKIVAPVGQVAPSLNYLWPSGNGMRSGYSGQVTVVDPTQNNNSGGNLLNNSAFKGTWTANQPQFWIADVGAPTTNWQLSTATFYAGTAQAFQFIGDSATLSSVYQSFANSSATGGNTTSLSPETVYLFRAMVKSSTSNPASGVLTFSLTDGSGTVLNDNTGNACTISYDLKTIGNTNFNAVSGAFRTPSNLTTVRLRMKLTQALSTGTNVFVDYMAMTKPTSVAYGGVYSGGPYIAAFRGSTDTIDFTTNPTIGDRWTLAINNDYGGLWQTWLWQVCNLPSIGIPIPSAIAPTIADTLIS